MLNNNKKRYREGMSTLADVVIPHYEKGEEIEFIKGADKLKIGEERPSVTYVSTNEYFITVDLHFKRVTFRSTIHKADLITGDFILKKSTGETKRAHKMLRLFG